MKTLSNSCDGYLINTRYPSDLTRKQLPEATKAVRDFLGITSHVNYRTDGKWDIDRLLIGMDWLMESMKKDLVGGAAAVSKPSVNEDNLPE